MTDIGVRLRRYREEHDLSQDELGELCGLTGSGISRIESGDRTKIQVGTLLKLSEELGITINELVAPTKRKAKATA